MRVLVVSDAWRPQVNGVVRTLEEVAKAARQLGSELVFLTPQQFRSMACPTYPEIRLAITTPGRIARQIEAVAPDHIHIATEGPLGCLARHYCRRHGLLFTTSYHTKFPEYVRARAPIPLRLTYALMRWFHAGAAGTMVVTRSLARDLAARGFGNLYPWSRGVDTDLFHPDYPPPLDLPRPVFINVGRVAVEKNLEAFLRLDLPGSKLVVGDGPALNQLKRRYPEVAFVGQKAGAELAAHYAMADVFVFPSLTDTFGNVMLEALACGVPVAAFPVTGPLDLIATTPAGVLHDDLAMACHGALKIARGQCREIALRHSWQACAAQFLHNIAAARKGAGGEGLSIPAHVSAGFSEHRQA